MDNYNTYEKENIKPILLKSVLQSKVITKDDLKQYV